MLDYLVQHLLLSYSLIGILGITIGSLLTVIIYRLPIMLQQEWHKQCADYLQLDTNNYPRPTASLRLFKPGFHCPQCQQPLSLSAHIPIISYLSLRGRCQNCAHAIKFRYPFIEILSGILAIALLHSFSWTWQFVLLFSFSCILICLIFIDLDHQLLPDQLTLSLLWLGLIANLKSLFCPLPDAVLGAIFGYIGLWTINYLFKLLRGQEGMGYGDFKLLAALGAWLGWYMLPLIILLSSLSGTLVGLYLIICKGHQRQNPIPFGPYLAVAGWFSLYWGEPLLNIFRQVWS